MNTSTRITSGSMTARCVRRVTLATVLCVLSTAPSWAAPTSITVSFRDLDPSGIAGATTLYHRIQSAAKQVCGYASGQTSSNGPPGRPAIATPRPRRCAR